MLGALAALNPASMLGTAASMGGSILNYKGAKDTNAKQIELAREQMDFQERMSNTAYQRAMDDMSEAGLNPILAYQQGGASSPGGAMPVIQNPMAAATNAGVSLMNSASNVATQSSQRDKLAQEVENLTAQYELTWAQRQQVYMAAQKLNEEAQLVVAQTEGVQHDNVQKQILADFYDSAEFARIAKDIGLNPGTLKGIFGALFGGKKRGK